MKVATETELERLAPLDSVQLEDGPRWRITVRCPRCQAVMHLLSQEKPSAIARGIAAGLMRRVVGTPLCDTCSDRLEAEEEQRETAEKFRDRLSASQLPRALHGFEFREMIVTDGRKPAIEAARAWASESEAKGLCLFGGVGAGKTRCAATATWQRLKRAHVTWVSMPILIAQLGAAFSDAARREAIGVLTGTGALVLDDLDKIKPSEWAVTQVFAALDKRIQAGAPLLVTTNKTPTQLGEQFGEPVMSRIVGYCRVLELPGRDMRLQLPVDGKEKGDE